jgi:hypothetical protein
MVARQIREGLPEDWSPENDRPKMQQVDPDLPGAADWDALETENNDLAAATWERLKPEERTTILEGATLLGLNPTQKETFLSEMEAHRVIQPDPNLP